MKYSIVIATYNRAPQLADTLASLSQLQSHHSWEVILVDNNSSDDTAPVVAAASRDFPVPLRYVFEQEQGRSAALNTGMALAHGDIIVTTDDDVRVPCEWLDAIGSGLAAHGCDYVGGRVTPLWEMPPPRWFPQRSGHLWGVVALLDYGPTPVKFGTRVPLGVNMALTRTAFERVGGFDSRIGRKAGTLLGQEVREWCLRAHAHGLVGYYIPSITLQHLIPRDRLTKHYFRRWFYWRGISRALLYAQAGLDMEAPERTALDFTQVPHVAGVPRYMFRTALAAARDTMRDRVAGRAAASFERELWLWMFAGIVKQRWHDRLSPPPRAALRPTPH
jgi:glycosyltransferase involved in cell wall biosynthesis